MVIASLCVSEAAKLEASYCAEFFPRRYERAKKFIRQADFLRCVGAGALLAGVLHIREEELAFQSCGKPFLPGAGLHFSLSHSGDYTVLAADDLPVGVDLETAEADRTAVAPRVYTADELRWMEEDPVSRFYDLWTMKESILKNTGVGFTADPRSFSVLPLLQNGQAPLFGGMRYGKTAALGTCRLSVCADRPVEPLSFRSYTAEELMRR